MGRVINYLLPIASLGVGFLLGGNFEINSRKNAEGYVEKRAERDKGKASDVLCLDRGLINDSRDEEIELFIERNKSLEASLLEVQEESSLLREQLQELRKQFGLYDFSKLSEPSGSSVEERFENLPEYYLGNVGHRWGNLIELIRDAIRERKSMINLYLAPPEVDHKSHASMDFHSFGSMEVERFIETWLSRSQVRSPYQYEVRVGIKEGVVKVEPFSSGVNVRMIIKKAQRYNDDTKYDALVMELIVRSAENENNVSVLDVLYNKRGNNEIEQRIRLTPAEISETGDLLLNGSSTNPFDQRGIRTLEEIMSLIDEVFK